MITHFQYKPLYQNKEIPGWQISFYYQRQKYRAVYHPDGKIEWLSNGGPADEEAVCKQIHELMVFHVYDQ